MNKPELPDLKWLRENLDCLNQQDMERAIILLIDALEGVTRELNDLRDKNMQKRMME
jgi:hypothetical protein